MSLLAILILTRNEEENIVSVVENAKKCTDEVIIIDSGSTDRTVDLAKVDSRIQEIIFTVTIHDATARKQNFGQVHNSYIRIYDANTETDIARYDLDEDFSIETAVEFGRLYKKGAEWKFEAMGIGYKGGLQYFVDKYVG